MFKRFVQKPYTVLVAVIIALIIGGVSLTKLSQDLLPEINVPYLIIVTTYPGASPERVESDVTKPMENALGTISGLENVTSTSSENYSVVMLEFNGDMNMDSAMVKVNTQLETVKDFLPENCGNPNIIEMSTDMMATIYASVSYDGMDIYQISDFTENEILPELERQEGVASITALGLVEKTVEIRLNQEKIDDINDRILEKTNKKLKESGDDLEDAKDELDESNSKVKSGKKKLSGTQSSTADQLADVSLQLTQAEATIAAYNSNLVSLQAQQAALQAEMNAYAAVDESYSTMDEMFKATYEAMKAQKEAAIEAAKAKARADALAAAGAGSGSSSGETSGSTGGETSDPESGDGEEGGEDAGAEEGNGGDADDAGSSDGGQQTPSKPSSGDIDTSAAEKAAAEAAAAAFPDLPKDLKDAVEHEKLFNNFLEIAKASGQDVSNLTYENIKQVYNIKNTRIPQIETELANLNTEIIAAQAMVDMANAQKAKLDAGYKAAYKGAMSAAIGFGSADAQMAAAESAIEQAQKQLEDAEETYQNAVKAARDNANLDALLTMETLSSLIFAQNFAMPAGYIDDENDDQWLLKIGEHFDSVDDLKNLVLCTIDDIGDVTLDTVSDITIIDNAADSYEKVNGQQAVILAIYKTSTAGTSDVSKTCKAAMHELEDKFEGLHLTELMDQGDYIVMFIETILKSMLIGALLAVIILAIFLKDVKPTLVVAFSIPFSVLVTLILMYMMDISINVMSLGGLSLAIGMLVDNSVVVIENIYRLRGRGLAAPRAAVQGTKQVAAPIVSSTLTTICVFLPLIFTSGYVRQMMLPFALTIGFALAASLIVALAVVPVVGSTLLKKSKQKRYPLFEKVQNIYGVILGKCLKVKIVPLLIAVGLLAFSIFEIVQMGISVFPEMTSEQIMITVNMPEEMTKDEARATADDVMNRIMSVENVETVGVITNAGSLFGGTSRTEDYLRYGYYILPAEGIKNVDEIEKICEDIESATEGMACEVKATASDSSAMSAYASSGLQIDLTGREVDKLLEVSEDIMKILEETEGCIEVSNGQEDGDKEVYLMIDKTKAMRDTLTVAQIYQKLNSRLTTEDTAINITIDNSDMDVKIVDETDVMTLENILDTPFDVTKTNDDGESETETHLLSEYVTIRKDTGVASIARDNGTRTMHVTCKMDEGYNETLVGREVEAKLAEYHAPEGYHVTMGGSTEQVAEMLKQMSQMLALGAVLVYLVMVAQFQSLLSPFIVILTVPLAFTGGLLGLLATDQQLTMLSLVGFLVLMGTIVNNGIVFVDYANQLRIGGMNKRDALIMTGKTRMRPILMTALTTILAMVPMVVSQEAGDSMSKGMAIVIVGGMTYATFMTLFIVPVMYDILYRKQPTVIDIGDDSADDAPDDAAEFIEQMRLAQQSADNSETAGSEEQASE